MADYTIYIILGCVIVLLLLGTLILLRRYRRSKMPQGIPVDVLAEFNRAEQLAREYKGTITPQEILWKINEERKNVYTHLKDVPAELRKDVIDEVRQLEHQPQVQPKQRLNINNLFKKKQQPQW